MHTLVEAEVDAPVWTSLYAAVAIGFIRALPAVDDAVVLLLLPALRAGLKADTARECQVRGVAACTTRWGHLRCADAGLPRCTRCERIRRPPRT